MCKSIEPIQLHSINNRVQILQLFEIFPSDKNVIGIVKHYCTHFQIILCKRSANLIVNF